LNVKDHSISGEEFTICICDNCGLKFTNPRPSSDNIARYYESEDYISHSNKKSGLIPVLYQKVRNITLKQKLKLLRSFQPKAGRILDYGCGTGEFLNTMRSAGWECIGLEPGDKAANAARNNYGLEIKDPASLRDLPDASFDVITLWHVLEHVHDLDNTLSLIVDKLKSSGTIFIAVPNASSWDAEHYGDHWAAYDVPRHLYHFHSGSIGKLFANHGLNLQKVLPMKWDAFYVSMLSEKYLGNNLTTVRGLVSGINGNLHGSGDLNRYSSLIFIGEKSL
jgi:SAM-dependent methyltransferase